jgi:hypothetical protein
MIIETKTANPGKIFVTLENIDFKRRDPKDGQLVWRNALDWLKSDIPTDQREYDDDLRIWIIEDNSDNRAILQAIKNTFFIDKNQMRIF